MWPAEDLQIIAVLSHYTPTYIPVSDEYTITGPWLICYVEIYTDDIPYTLNFERKTSDKILY